MPPSDRAQSKSYTIDLSLQHVLIRIHVPRARMICCRLLGNISELRVVPVSCSLHAKLRSFHGQIDGWIGAVVWPCKFSFFPNAAKLASLTSDIFRIALHPKLHVAEYIGVLTISRATTVPRTKINVHACCFCSDHKAALPCRPLQLMYPLSGCSFRLLAV
jgi:hypothetical protein